MSSRLFLLLALTALAASPALAGDEVVTARPVQTVPSTAAIAPLATDSQPQQLYAKPQGYESNGRTIHGGGGVAIGTGGYRSGYVYTEIPVGEDGTLGLAYSQTDFGKNSYYGWGRGGGQARSASVFLDMSHASDPQQDDACAPGFRDGSRVIEPLWVTRMRGRDCTPSDRP